MSKLFSVLVGFFWALMVHAECMNTMIQFYPSGNTIRQNSIFIIEGFGDAQRFIPGLNHPYKVYLKSSKDIIPLSVLETHQGQFQLTQAILKPSKLLTAGLEYTLYIDSLPKANGLKKYNAQSPHYAFKTYRVLAGKDIQKPRLSGDPKEIKKTFVMYGCGPSANVVFSNPATDASELFIKATVRNPASGSENSYWIRPNAEQILLGHGMCSGAFVFEDKQQYEVHFEFIDASGNRTKMTGPAISFTGPMPENSLNEESDIIKK